MDFALYSQIFNSSQFQLIFKILLATAPIWLSAFLAFWLWNIWVVYVRTRFLAEQSNILLEIKLPREIFKSPKAMEFFIASLWQIGGELTWINRYWEGKTRATFSLEIASVDGSVHFFIYTRKGFKNQIEANLYSQYPGVEIYEVPDYTVPVSFDPAVHNLWATEFKLNKPDAYPIKTYVDYGMDKDPKEEYKIDPMTPLVEFLGSLNRGHHAWIQIILRAHKAEDAEKDPKTGVVKMVDLKWKKAAAEEIKKIYDSVKDKKDEETGKETKGRLLTEGEKETVSALERSISKNGFDVGIRIIYTASKEIYSADNIGGIVGGMMHYNSGSLNSFGLMNVPDSLAPYPWQDRSKKKRNFAKKLMLDAYKNRGYFYNEFKKPHFVLNTEELATIFHLPGGMATTPAFERVGSKKAEAPSNLPL